MLNGGGIIIFEWGNLGEGGEKSLLVEKKGRQGCIP